MRVVLLEIHWINVMFSIKKPETMFAIDSRLVALLDEYNHVKDKYELLQSNKSQFQGEIN